MQLAIHIILVEIRILTIRIRRCDSLSPEVNSYVTASESAPPTIVRSWPSVPISVVMLNDVFDNAST